VAPFLFGHGVEHINVVTDQILILFDN